MDQDKPGELPRVELPKFDLGAEAPTKAKREALLALFPEARSDNDSFDFDILRFSLGDTVDTAKERFGLTWPGRADCFRTIQTPTLATLLPVPSESVAFDGTGNVYIEADNLEALKLLQKSYLASVKLIYIDPPYNTGNDFIYPDNFAESLKTYLQYTRQVDSEGRKFSSNTDTEGRFHAKWLSMMYPRLYLAKNLLRRDGFLVVSIDDAELPNLIAILDDVFGEENRVATLVYDRNRKNDAKFFSVGHEYMLVYANDKQYLREQKVILRASKEGIEEVRSAFTELRAKWKRLGRHPSRPTASL